MAQLGPFTWGAAGQKLSPTQVKKYSDIAAALAARSGAPQNLGEGLNRVGEALLHMSMEGKAAAGEEQGRAARAEVMQALMGNPDPQMSDLMGAMGNEWVQADPGSSAVVQALLSQEMKQNDPLYQMQIEQGQLELDALRNPPPPAPEYGFTFAPDGSLIRTDKTSGNFDTLGQFGAAGGADGFTLSPGQIRYGPNGEIIAQADEKPVLPEAPVTRTFYDEATGREVVKQWNPASQAWDTIGGIKAPTSPMVTVNTGDNSNAFNTEGDKLAASRLGTVVEAGQGAATFMGDLQTLAALAPQIGTGKGAEIMNALGPYAQAVGIDIQGLGEGQAFQSIVDRLAPQMRPAGSGASSDFDARQFLSSLPSLGKEPEGNQIIMQTLTALQQHKMAAADIASKAFLPAERGGITWQEAEEQIRALPNPYQGFNEYKKRGDAAVSAIGAKDASESGDIDWNAPTPPPGWKGDPELWQHMPPEDRALFQ